MNAYKRREFSSELHKRRIGLREGKGMGGISVGSFHYFNCFGDCCILVSISSSPEVV